MDIFQHIGWYARRGFTGIYIHFAYKLLTRATIELPQDELSVALASGLGFFAARQFDPCQNVTDFRVSDSEQRYAISMGVAITHMLTAVACCFNDDTSYAEAFEKSGLYSFIGAVVLGGVSVGISAYHGTITQAQARPAM